MLDKSRRLSGGWPKSRTMPRLKLMMRRKIVLDMEDGVSVLPSEETGIERFIETERVQQQDTKQEVETDYVDESEEVITEVKSTNECLTYLKEVTNRFIASGVEPPIHITHLENTLRQHPLNHTKITDFLA